MRLILEESDLNEQGKKHFEEHGLEGLELHHFRKSMATFYRSDYVSFESEKIGYKVFKDRYARKVNGSA